jgi:hypothetical protein
MTIEKLTPKDQRLLELQLKLDEVFQKQFADPNYRKSHSLRLSEN